MKKSPSIARRSLKGIAVALLAVFASSPSIEAKETHSKAHHRKSHDDDEREKRRKTYHSASQSSFHLSIGDGYAGRGYYYGPANSSYYYAREGVHFYHNRESAPRAYYSELPRIGESSALVQRALARRGYYSGPIDGQIGPQTHRAVARYQNDHGLRANGNITQSLLASLGIR